MAQILVQQLDENNDPIEGANGPVFLANAEAVAQIILTTLRLLMGEWWENLSVGFPLFQNLLGKSAAQSNQSQALMVIQNAIYGVPFVLNILNFSLIGNTGPRAMYFTATVQTAFGNVVVTNSPGTSAQVSS